MNIKQKPLKTVRIMGTQGIPAKYGGFETAAENIALYLVSRGWRVIVYCQASGKGPITEDVWKGIERVIIPVNQPSWKGTSMFDWLCISHALKFRNVCLTFGYNTGIFHYRLRLAGIPHIVNMDGIEWARKRWGAIKQGILYVNERFAALFANHLIADHPDIETYLWTRAPKCRISTITYGAHPLSHASSAPIEALGLESGRYLIMIERTIPENSIWELVKAFSMRKRDHKLVVLGAFRPEYNPYHLKLKQDASDEVVFTGPIYDKETVQSLRFHAKAFLHGHTLGGTSPTLVESMAAGTPILSHNNHFNIWTAGEAALYFDTPEDADDKITQILADEDLRKKMRQAGLRRYNEEFTWEHVASQYEELIARYLDRIR
jgi:glycosyltransferase involved in cell wall biosynthesis